MEYIVTGKIQWEALPEGTSESGKRLVTSSAALFACTRDL